MTTKIESDIPSSPQNDESDGEEQEIEPHFKKEEKEDKLNRPLTNVAHLVARLQSTGTIKTKTKQDYRCFTCELNFLNWEELENHLIKHVSLPSVVLNKLQSGEEDLSPSGDENWSEEEDVPAPTKFNAAKTPQRLSRILQKTGISSKQNCDSNAKSSESRLNKLNNLRCSTMKNTNPIKKEKQDQDPEKKKALQKLENLGGIKLKLKSDGNNTNSFKVVNGLRDFKASDDEEEESYNAYDKEEQGFDKEEQEYDDENYTSVENEGSGGEQNFDDKQSHTNRNRSESSDSDKGKTMVTNLPKSIQGTSQTPKEEPVNTLNVPPVKMQQAQTPQVKLPNRPVIKQTPKRASSMTIIGKDATKKNEPPVSRRLSQNVALERRRSSERGERCVVKEELADNTGGEVKNNLPMFTDQIKSERSTTPFADRTTPILARVKSEPEIPTSVANSEPLTGSLLPVSKAEEIITIIEINGDSNDEDDDCCVVSTTPAPDVKPIVPKIEQTPTYSTPAQSSYTTSLSGMQSPPSNSNRLSTEKQHNFNWNAPDNKPPLDMLEKSTDDIFESLLSSSSKKENMTLSDASEYVSLDSLGPQHSCDICNTRFTDIPLLEEHKRVTGHSKSLVPASSSSLMPYNHSSTILSSLLPVKQIAEQVGKLSTIANSGPGFTHQQNVMINIQAYPGAGSVIVPPQYNAYNSGQNLHGSYPQTSSNMYGPTSQPMSMPNQYQGQNYVNQGYGQYQTSMSKPAYPGTIPSNSYSMPSSPYSTASPLQSMQQSVYGQSGGLMNTPGSMGPPGSSPSHTYTPTSSSGEGIKQQGSGVKIQNIQTFSPGQIIGVPGQSVPGQPVTHGIELGPGKVAPPGQTIAGQIPGITPIRMAAGANIAGQRLRMPTARGPRPTIRPGIQVHGQTRGGKVGPRMALKRPGAVVGGPGQKRRTDMLLPGKHDNEDCQVMAMQKQREGLPMIHSVQGAKDRLNLGSQLSITKNVINRKAHAMANVLTSRGISVKPAQKSRSPSPESPLPHLPNLGSAVSIKHTSKSSKLSITETKVGNEMYSCKICKKMFMNHNSLQVHLLNAHPQSKLPAFKCDECPASYPKSLQLHHHKRVFHNVTGPNRELGLPVVDLSQEDNLNRLSHLGIYSFIPLANREQANGCFGIPVISVHNMQNGLTSSLQALGADGLLSLGPLKPLPNS